MVTGASLSPFTASSSSNASTSTVGAGLGVGATAAPVGAEPTESPMPDNPDNPFTRYKDNAICTTTATAKNFWKPLHAAAPLLALAAGCCVALGSWLKL